MSQPNYLTPEGEAKLQAELEDLKGPRRDDLSARLRSAIQMGDLSENADYHKAKEDQGFLEGRIHHGEVLFLRHHGRDVAAEIVAVGDGAGQLFVDVFEDHRRPQ